MTRVSSYLQDVLRSGPRRPRAWDCAEFCLGWLDRADLELAERIRLRWPEYEDIRDAHDLMELGRVSSAAMYCDFFINHTSDIFGPVFERTDSPRPGDIAFMDGEHGAPPVMGLIEDEGQGVFLSTLRSFKLVPAHRIEHVLTWAS